MDAIADWLSLAVSQKVARGQLHRLFTLVVLYEDYKDRLRKRFDTCRDRVSRKGHNPRHPDNLTELYARCDRLNTRSVTASLPDSDTPLPQPVTFEEPRVRTFFRK